MTHNDIIKIVGWAAVITGIFLVVIITSFSLIIGTTSSIMMWKLHWCEYLIGTFLILVGLIAISKLD